ncbi:hypothetical protein EB75_09930 [Mycobacterium sp. ST-F2]|nr:hypothetical protein EB75_09930 [Mycobacterium sp. ST-F2]
MNTHAAQQICRISTTRGQEPASRVPAPQRRRSEHPADQRIAVTHRVQQQPRGSGRLLGVTPEPVRPSRSDQERNPRREAETTDDKPNTVDRHDSQRRASRRRMRARWSGRVRPYPRSAPSPSSSVSPRACAAPATRPGCTEPHRGGVGDSRGYLSDRCARLPA